jgi:hypothetical protein
VLGFYAFERAVDGKNLEAKNNGMNISQVTITWAVLLI